MDILSYGTKAAGIKIEHMLLPLITNNLGGNLLISFEVIVNLIANTRTEKSLRVE